MTRLWSMGESITVEETALANRAPRRFHWQAQTHQVLEVTQTWRVDVDWWRTRIWRTYFKLSTDTGLLVIIYQDLIDQQWYLQRLYD
ncbi:MAG: hypothetical protein R3300_01195 [Candidatus Promineifilaceae bacterium]|nr:hypothetical protein [Candidatus Promineifilaceae bacterium]